MNWIHIIWSVFDISYIQVEFRTHLTNMGHKLVAVAISFTNNDSEFLYSFKWHYEQNPLHILKYAELVEHRGWHFFERFLSVLDKQEVCIMFFKYMKSRLPTFYLCSMIFKKAYCKQSCRLYRQWTKFKPG